MSKHGNAVNIGGSSKSRSSTQGTLDPQDLPLIYSYVQPKTKEIMHT